MKNDNQNKEFIEKCRSIDFSAESVNKDRNLEILKGKLKNIENEREITMNKKIKKPMAFIIVAAAIICISAGIYGQDLFRIVKTVTLGNYAEYMVIEDKREFIPIPEELLGQVFDIDGNELKVFPDDRRIYNADGVEVMPIFDDGKARLMTPEEYQTMHSERTTGRYTTTDLEEGKSYFICDTLSPEYLPEGFVFDRVQFYGDPRNKEEMEQGVQKYMAIYYTNGKQEMYSQIRYMDEETAFGSSGTAEIQKIKINGYDAVIDGNTLDIQIGDVMYMFFATEGLSTDELVKMAESLK